MTLRRGSILGESFSRIAPGGWAQSKNSMDLTQFAPVVLRQIFIGNPVCNW